MRLTRRAFRRLVQQAIAELHPEVLQVLDNVAIVVEDTPTPEQLGRVDLDEQVTLLGLYEGIPLTERAGYNMVLPDKITLFRRPLEAATSSSGELKEEIKTTIVHEIAHHVGWSDADLEQLGYA
ncbi:MAG: metallopeptidase family protein [Dehalococcoidia bacterium]|nr:metallopeptidase family protein [Dehalococcoidia bacterium]